MIWSNLKKNICPECNRNLVDHAVYTETMIECECGFRISQRKYKQIVTNMISQADRNIDWDKLAEEDDKEFE